MSKLASVIGELDEEELHLAKRELDAGSLAKLITERINEKNADSWNNICPVCHTPIEEESMTLIFGPSGLRKKASFCATDCLEYFLQRIKQQKQVHKLKEEEEQ